MIDGAVVTDPQAVLEDLLTIWQSELAGLVVDREAQAAAVRFCAAWTTLLRAGATAIFEPGLWTVPGHEPAAGPSRTDAPAGTAAVDHASGGADPDERDAVIERLRARVAELERGSRTAVD